MILKTCFLRASSTAFNLSKILIASSRDIVALRLCAAIIPVGMRCDGVAMGRGRAWGV